MRHGEGPVIRHESVTTRHRRSETRHESVTSVTTDLQMILSLKIVTDA